MLCVSLLPVILRRPQAVSKDQRGEGQDEGLGIIKCPSPRTRGEGAGSV